LQDYPSYSQGVAGTRTAFFPRRDIHEYLVPSKFRLKKYTNKFLGMLSKEMKRKKTDDA
jgi:hypothetical protein